MNQSSIQFGLLGEKLGHSYSKQIHEKLADYTYDLCPLTREEFPVFMEQKAFKAVNVTIPYKKDVITYLDEMDENAAAIGAVNTIAKAAELTQGVAKPLEKVGVVYNYVVNNLTYDRQLAATVKSGYLPDLDSVLAKKKGICFDYAALMTGMLRSQGVPCKLVVGYAGTAYHAWVSVWTEETGWVEGAIYFDGTTWHRMDPTFASSQHNSEQILNYIGNGKNYKVKYLY